jgi:hypothetical protein
MLASRRPTAASTLTSGRRRGRHCLHVTAPRHLQAPCVRCSCPASEVREPSQQPPTRTSEAKGHEQVNSPRAAFDLKFLVELAAPAGGTSNRRHEWRGSAFRGLPGTALHRGSAQDTAFRPAHGNASRRAPSGDGTREFSHDKAISQNFVVDVWTSRRWISSRHAGRKQRRNADGMGLTCASVDIPKNRQASADFHHVRPACTLKHGESIPA